MVPSPKDSFKDKVVAITGAAYGLGAALADAFFTQGARLALCDINHSALTEKAHQSGLTTALLSKVDVSNHKEVENWVLEIKDKFGGCDVLINNAGITNTATFEQHTLEDWHRVFDVNMWGVVHCTKSFLPLLKESKGHIINISSIFGIVAMPAQTAYASSKYAIRGFSECLWEELKDEGICVTVVHPGGLATKIIEHSTTSSQTFKHHTQKFFERHALDPNKAAELIINGAAKRKLRLLIGKEAVLFDRAKRLFPVRGNHWVFKQIRKAMRLEHVEQALVKGE
ncbi:MAG: acetoin dehydrogenase [Proteobacteria bacterium]|nr:acetoin dehydrogenase [Pseudomonadota bacterium]